MFDDCSSDPLDQIHDGLAALACEDRAGWSGARCADRLVGLRALQERVDAEVVRAVADCDAVDAWQEAALGAVSWLAAKTGMLRHAATALIRTARLTRRHAQTAKALEAGDITVPHVELLAEGRASP